MPDYIDLRPLLASPAAAEMLLRARGQLNRAFRQHGLAAPDPLLVGDLAALGPAELDDPAAGGIEHATERFHEAFVAWAGRMPLKLASPVLDILRGTHKGLTARPEDPGAAGTAVLEAHSFLLARSQAGGGQPNAMERRPEPHVIDQLRRG